MRIRSHLKHFLHPQRSNNHRPKLLSTYVLFLLAFASISTIATTQFLVPIFNSYIASKYNLVLGVTSDITTNEIIDLTNQERDAHGLTVLSSNPVLSKAAEKKAGDMFNKQYWSHVSTQGKQPWDFIADEGYSYSVAGENLARDFQHSNEVVKAWMASPTHKANILHEKYTEIGVAVVEGNLEGIETTLVVQMFATPVTAAHLEELSAVPVRENILADQEVAMQSQTGSNINSPTVSGYSISPVSITKGVFLAILLIIIVTLIYDFMIVSHTKVVRVVGKNMAHVFLFLVVVYLVLYYKTGYII